MAITDNYTIVGHSDDNFNCDAVDGWVKGGNAEDPTAEDNKVEGDKALGLTTSDKDESWWYHDITEGNRFKIIEQDLGLWFFYVKGKGDNVLVQDSTALVIRLYFGGTDKYADYRLTEQGDKSLAFGWQMLMCSGKALNGGSVGGGHDDAADWELDIHRFEFRINCANKAENPLGLDAIFVGTHIVIDDGDEDTPVTMEDLEAYTMETRDGFPIGTVQISGRLVNIRSGVTITGGYVLAQNMYLLFNQLSSEVPHNVLIDGGILRIGTYIDGKAYNGCQIVKPEDRTGSFTVGTSGVLEVYNSKFYRWDTIEIAGNSRVVYSDFDSNDELLVTSEDVHIRDITVHDATSNNSIYAMRITANTTDVEGVMVYRNTNGVLFSADSQVKELILLDIVDYDVTVQDGYTPRLTDSDYTSIRRIS